MKFTTVLLASYTVAAPVAAPLWNMAAARASGSAFKSQMKTFGSKLAPQTTAGKVVGGVALFGAGATVGALGIKSMISGPNVIGPDPNDPANQEDLEQLGQTGIPMLFDSEGFPVDVSDMSTTNSNLPIDANGVPIVQAPPVVPQTQGAVPLQTQQVIEQQVPIVQAPPVVAQTQGAVPVVPVQTQQVIEPVPIELTGPGANFASMIGPE